MEDPKISKIAEDARGASYSVLLPDDTEMILIYSKKGAMRGGHSHDFPEVSIVLSGAMKYRKKLSADDEGEMQFTEGPGDALHNLPGEVHLAEAVEDGWLMDWKIGPKTGQCKTTNYAPYRKLVNEQPLLLLRP